MIFILYFRKEKMKRQILNLVRRLFFLYSEKKRKSKNLYRYINFEQI